VRAGRSPGVIAAYLLLHPRVRVGVLAFPHHSAQGRRRVGLGAWAATQFAMLLLGPREVAWWAHIGGMAAGAVLILFLRRPGVPLFDRARLAPD
jgi:membrane associated rhomboid family serine protease